MGRTILGTGALSRRATRIGKCGPPHPLSYRAAVARATLPPRRAGTVVDDQEPAPRPDAPRQRRGPAVPGAQGGEEDASAAVLGQVPQGLAVAADVPAGAGQ